MVRRTLELVSLTIPFEDRQTDPIFAENVLEDVWDMVRAVRKKSGPREQSYMLAWPEKGQIVDIIVRRRVNGARSDAEG